MTVAQTHFSPVICLYSDAEIQPATTAHGPPHARQAVSATVLSSKRASARWGHTGGDDVDDDDGRLHRPAVVGVVGAHTPEDQQGEEENEELRSRACWPCTWMRPLVSA